jgi:hypothetical protein
MFESVLLKNLLTPVSFTPKNGESHSFNSDDQRPSSKDSPSMPRGDFNWTPEERCKHSQVCRASRRLSLEQKICVILVLERPAPPRQVMSIACSPSLRLNVSARAGRHAAAPLTLSGDKSCSQLWPRGLALLA